MRNTATEITCQYCHAPAVVQPHHPLLDLPPGNPRTLLAAIRFRSVAAGRDHYHVPHDPVPDLKSRIGAELAKHVAGWRRAEIATLIDAEPARVSDLRNGKLKRFSLETLLRYASRLGYSIELSLVQRRSASFKAPGAK